MKLSVITICYNSEKTLERTIQSVLSQKTDEIEYIIIDGLSQDGTMEIVNKYRDRIDKIVSEKDKGISDAFNKGIARAEGDFVAIINSDDQFLPGAFEQLFREAEPDTDVFFGNGIRLYEDGRCKKYMADPDVSKLHDGMSLVHPSTFVRKSAYDKFGVFRVENRYIMDRELLLRMLNGGAKFQYSEGFYSVYSMGGVSDKSYLKGVVPESYALDLQDGKSKFAATKGKIQRHMFFRLLKVRDFIKSDDRNKIPFDEMMKIIGK